VKRPPPSTLLNEPDSGLERIKRLEEQLARTPINSQQHRTLRAAIRLEAGAYRKSLDIEQASARHGAKS
jgi:hypothetical protein